jgi:hypothetical protein
MILSCLLFSGIGRAADQELRQFVEQVSFIDTATASLQLGDRSFNYTNFIIVQNYRADEGQRLPLHAAREGTWVLIDAEYSIELQTYIARRLLLLPSEAVAKQLRENL